MKKIPKFAIRDGKRRVEVLTYQGNNHFDVLEVVGTGRSRCERRLLIHRSRLTFLPDHPATTTPTSTPRSSASEQPRLPDL